jgi:hypothetical protein
MLTEVKKEVDFMVRAYSLKGRFIDRAYTEDP